MKPILSVVMSTYNRKDMLSETIESILSQSFTDFEFIIVDDNSTDGTFEYLKSINDSRLKVLKNSENKGCTFNYHVAHNLSKGRYIAHIDDDDISLSNRFERQVDFLENNPDIALVGSFIETFGENKRPSWVFYTEPEKLDFVMNFYNPICHSSIVYNKYFMEKNAINYNLECKCAQDYDFYKQILVSGGRIANIDEVLVRYRMHSNRLTDIKNTQQIQINVAEQVKKELQSRFLTNSEYEEATHLLTNFPYNKYDLQNVLLAFEMVKTKGFYATDIVDSVICDIKNNLFKF